MSTYNPDDLANTYPLGKALFFAIVKAKADWGNDIDHVEDMWTLSAWQVKDGYQKAAETFLEDVKTAAVAVIEREPDYWNRGHFYEGKRHVLRAVTDLDKLPIGTQVHIQAAGGTP